MQKVAKVGWCSGNGKGSATKRQSCGCHLLEGQGSATKSGSDRRSSVNLARVSCRRKFTLYFEVLKMD